MYVLINLDVRHHKIFFLFPIVFFLKKWVGRADFIFIFYLPNENEGIKFTD